MLADVILIVVVAAFAWNLGVHYTGAVMGMPYASRAVTATPALVLIGILTIIGATFASGDVQERVGLNIIDPARVTVPDATVIVLAAGILTTVYNYYKIPTSTIQILVFCVAGVGLAGSIPIFWDTIGKLAIVWVLAPIAAFALGFLFTRLLDVVIPPEAARAQVAEQVAPVVLAARAREVRTVPSGGLEPAISITGRAYLEMAPDVGVEHQSIWTAWFPTATRPLPEDVREIARETTRVSPSLTLLALRWLPGLLVLVGIGASFVLGANDVANATAVLVMTDKVSPTEAGLIGGVLMAVGAITWGRRILRTVAFDVVRMDLTMASAAQGVQALVVLAAVTQGFFTSMNQALIGAMAGTGMARGRETVQRRQIIGILRGWVIGPISGLALAAALEGFVRLFVR
jgi:PiT family inorganic phosphate transporter